MTNQNTARKNEALIALYRFTVCSLSLTVILCTLALHLTNALSFDSFADKLLFSVSKEEGKQEEADNLGKAHGGNNLPKNDNTDSSSSKRDGEEEKAEGEEEVSFVDYDYTIKSSDMGCYDDYLTLRNNETDYAPDTKALLALPYPKELTGKITNEPLVLVIHTHATECYTSEGAEGISSDTAFRSSDTELNTVKVGSEFCRVLEDNGISCIHCTKLHDENDYNASYANSLESVKYYLEKYPSIKYIFDIHRDAIFRNETDAVKPLCKIDGKDTAQIMLVCGSNAKGADHPEWQDNLSVCLKLQKKLCDAYPPLMRKIDLRGASFNQQYSKGFMLVEVGSCANTLSEALSAVRLFASCTAEMIKEYSE